MITIIKTILEYLAIACFVGLTGIGIIQKAWNFGVFLNAVLVFLYIALYIQPLGGK